MSPRTRVAAFATAALLGPVLGPTLAASAVPAAQPLSTRIAVHFDASTGQLPENIALAPNGAVDVTFAASRQVVEVSAAGAVRVLVTMPAPADGGVHTPALGFALTTGIVRTTDGTIYFLYASGASESTGLWRLTPTGSVTRIAALPANGLPNGLALDDDGKTFYITDSVLGAIYAVPAAGGPATVWSDIPALAARGFLGANGLKVHNRALWVSNLDQGTLLRFPLRVRDGGARPIVHASGLAGIDDFTFTGAGEEILAALVVPNTVVRIRPNGAVTTVLTAADGLQNPTSVAVRGGDFYVTSAAYLTGIDPNLLVGSLPRRS